MAIRIRSNLRDSIRQNPGRIWLEVRGADDPAGAERALMQARVDIGKLDGGWQSAPGLSPGDTNGPK